MNVIQMKKNDSTPERNLVIYHSHCWDGLAAVWVMVGWLHTRGVAAGKAHVENTVLAAKYGDAPPDVSGYHNVYIVDFSYGRETLQDMREAVRGEFYVLDHHKTAQEALSGLDYCHFDMERSGARMAWDFCYKDEEPPWFIRLIEDRDLWKWEYPDTEAFTTWLNSQPMEFATLGQLYDGDVYDTAVAAGEAMLSYQEQMVQGIAKNARLLKLCNGDTVYAVNTPVLSSEVGHALATEHGMGMTWYVQNDGSVKFSIRGDGDVDVSAIAKLYGGGGHAGAAGFALPAQMLNHIAAGHLPA